MGRENRLRPVADARRNNVERNEFVAVRGASVMCMHVGCTGCRSGCRPAAHDPCCRRSVIRCRGSIGAPALVGEVIIILDRFCHGPQDDDEVEEGDIDRQIEVEQFFS